MRRTGRRLLAVLVGLLLVGVLGEVAWRLFGDDPRLDQAASFHERVTRPDARLLYRLRPDLSANWRDSNPRDHNDVPFSTNSEGRRNQEFDSGGPGPDLLVACLGDSCTMGFGVADDAMYAYLLGRELAARHPGRRVRVLNFGTQGYTSAQGLRLLQDEVLPLEPDLVVLAFGYNDGYLNASDEASWYASMPSPAYEPVHRALSSVSHLYPAVWQRLFPRRSLQELRPRVGRVAFADNMRAMLEAIRQAGARPVVLDVDLPNFYLADTTRQLAEAAQAPYVCARELFQQAAVAAADAGGSSPLPSRLPPHPAEHVRIRWQGTEEPVLLAFDLADPSRRYHLLVLTDDGADGDDVAGDGVYTMQWPVPPEGLDAELAVTSLSRLRENIEHVNHVLTRRLVLAPGQGWHSDVLDTDTWLAGVGDFIRAELGDYGHPNPRGHALLATALANALATALGQH